MFALSREDGDARLVARAALGRVAYACSVALTCLWGCARAQEPEPEVVIRALGSQVVHAGQPTGAAEGLSKTAYSVRSTEVEVVNRGPVKNVTFSVLGERICFERQVRADGAWIDDSTASCGFSEQTCTLAPGQSRRARVLIEGEVELRLGLGYHVEGEPHSRKVWSAPLGIASP